MEYFNVSMRKIACGSAACFLFLTGSAAAAPSIRQVSGTLNHKSTVTITGSGFGSKSQVAPVVWDDASTGSVPSDNGKWDDGWPNQTDSSTFYTRYTTPIRSVPLPHNNVTRYIAGGHGNVGWTLQVGVFKGYPITSYPQPVYISYYYQVDPAWTFCPGDNNFKLGSHAQAGGPYVLPNWYYEHRSPDFTSSSIPGIFTPFIPDDSGERHTYFHGSAVNPLGKWVKVEYEALYTNQSNGYVKIWNDGKLGAQYNGPTDAGGLGTKTEGIGGYARCYGYPTNWRYFADVYFDTSRSRILLGNAPTYAASTIREVQIPSVWSTNSITVTVNGGKFANGQIAYLYVFDSSGEYNATGFPITVGGGKPLAAPTNLRVM